jgi:thiol-disulfide isomerase/thioredoxin
VKLSSLRGRPVLINFWATWCPPCRAEIPTLTQAYAEARGDASKEAPYEILGVATQSDLSTVKAFVKELGINFPVLPDADNRITNDLYHVVPIPTSFFIDKDGIIRFIQIGTLDRAALDQWLLK